MMSSTTITKRLKKITDDLNQEYFGGHLRYDITISDHQKQMVLAFVERPDTSRHQLLLHPVIHFTPKVTTLNELDLRNLVLHELCHVAQWVYHLEGGHGKSFKWVGKRHNIPEKILERKQIFEGI